jgi:hypothetical protein
VSVRCAACGEPVSYTDEGGCVGTDPAYHFKAECLLEAVRRADADLERERLARRMVDRTLLDAIDHVSRADALVKALESLSVIYGSSGRKLTPLAEVAAALRAYRQSGDAGSEGSSAEP